MIKSSFHVVTFHPHSLYVNIAFYQVHSGYLNHLIDVLHRIGYTYTTDGNSDWDLLWSHNYPFTDKNTQLQELKPYQKVHKA